MGGDGGNTMTKCNVVPYIGSWDRKKKKNDCQWKTSDTQTKSAVQLIVCTNVSFLALTNVQW